MPCVVCTHPQHVELLAALPHTALRVLATQYHLSKSVLQRHRRHGCPGEGETRPSGHRPACQAQVHQDALQLAAVLRNRQITVDVRLAVAELAQLVVQLTASLK